MFRQVVLEPRCATLIFLWLVQHRGRDLFYPIRRKTLHRLVVQPRQTSGLHRALSWPVIRSDFLQAQRVKGVFGCLLVLNKLALTNMANVKEIFNLMKKTSKKDLEFIDKAYNFAENAHKNHKRASGEP